MKSSLRSFISSIPSKPNIDFLFDPKRRQKLFLPPLFYYCRLLLFTKASFVKFRVEGIEITFIEFVGQQPQILTKPLIMHNLALAQEADSVLYIIIIRQPQDVVIGGSRFLLP